MRAAEMQRAAVDGALGPRAWEDAITQVLAEPARIEPVFQPIVDLKRGVVCGFEMLARFASRCTPRPPDWFAAARHQGRLGDLEAEVVAAGLAARHQVPPNCFLTINVSPDALVTPELWRVLHAEDQLEGLVFEVTEQTEVSDYATLGRALGVLRGAGAMIAVDDAGAGYASLATSWPSGPSSSSSTGSS